jgi:hypothetical protein
MAAPRRVIALVSDAAQRQQLQEIARSRTEPASRVERARIILGYLAEPSAYAVACAVGVTAQTVSRCLYRAAELGVIEALDDRQRTGRDPTITAEARTWLVALACQSRRRWGIRTSCGRRGCWPRMPVIGAQPPATPVWPNSLKGRCARSSRSRGQAAQGALLPGEARSGIRAKMAEILCIYRQVAVLREQGQAAALRACHAGADQHVEGFRPRDRRHATGTSACRRSAPPSRRSAIGRSDAAGAAAAVARSPDRTSAPIAAPFRRRCRALVWPGAPRHRDSSE